MKLWSESLFIIFSGFQLFFDWFLESWLLYSIAGLFLKRKNLKRIIIIIALFLLWVLLNASRWWVQTNNNNFLFHLWFCKAIKHSLTVSFPQDLPRCCDKSVKEVKVQSSLKQEVLHLNFSLIYSKVWFVFLTIFGYITDSRAWEETTEPVWCPWRFREGIRL